MHVISCGTSKMQPDQGDTLCADRDVLLESPNIGHSALVIYSRYGLARGILSMQRKGTFATHFDNNDDVLRGIAFFPGEAMLVLMSGREVHNNHYIQQWSIGIWKAIR